MTLNGGDIDAIEATERVCSILSLLGAAFIIITFLGDKAFHKPINRLVFYAAWGNIMANIATLIAVSGIYLGVDAPLCQFQAFLIQWFMPADALWTFAMACNVYLTFFRKYDAHQLRALEWKYVVFSYGLPFIPAFIYCFVETAQRGKVYGSAVLWCWVSLEWDALRIATFYGPVWLVIVATLAIYLRAGRIVFRWRRQLLNFAHHQEAKLADSGSSNSAVPLEIVKTTEFHVTTDLVAPWETYQKYNVSTGASERASTAQNHREEQTVSNAEDGGQAKSSRARSEYTHSNPLPRRIPTANANKAAVNYCKCAILFFVALLITWVPSTINRVYTLVYPGTVLFSMNYASGLVLPLQGFWNAVIYVATSFPACKALYARIVGKQEVMRDRGSVATRSGVVSTLTGDRRSGLRDVVNRREDWSESVEELTKAGRV